MSFQMPITKRKFQHHFQYSIWKYLLLIALALFGWNLLYTTTRYQSPESLRVEFYAQSSLSDADSLSDLADLIHDEVMPEMELVTATAVTISEDYYGDMQLTVWISAAQGDVYLISQDYFETFAASGAFLDLTAYIESGQLNTSDIDLTDGYIQLTDSDTEELYGIPADTITGLNDYLLTTEDMVLCILYNNGNDDYSIMFLNYLLENLR